jgi:hypothetical protein
MSYPTAAAAERADGSVVLFRFSYRAAPCRVVARGAAVSLQADLGILPFTSDGPSLRRSTLSVLERARSRPGYAVRLMPGHRFGLTVALPVEPAAPPASILAAALEQLADAKPLLDAVLLLLPKHLRHRPECPRMSASG